MKAAPRHETLWQSKIKHGMTSGTKPVGVTVVCTNAASHSDNVIAAVNVQQFAGDAA